MSATGMYAQERQQALVVAARERGRLGVREAANRFGVTAETIRRDLAGLEERGLLRRVHGGAVPIESLGLVERDVVERIGAFAEQKTRIGRAALAHLPHGAGSSVLIDSGTTTARFAAVLPPDPDLVVVTNSPHVALTLAPRHPAPVHVVGGRLRGTTQATVGAPAVAEIATLRVDVAVLGTNGITAAHGCSTPDAEEAAVKAAMVRSARRIVVLADSSKAGRESLHSFVALADVDVLVTDTGLPRADRDACEAAGVEVVMA